MKKLLFILLLTIPFVGFGQDTGYHIDYIGDIYKTVDSGVNWTLQGNHVGSTDGKNYCFVTQTIGYSSGNGIYKTTDSGINWTLQNNTGPIGNISFVNSTVGYGNQNGNIYKTTDSGITWTLQYNFPGTESGINFVNNNITSTFNIPTPSSNKKLEKVVDILGRETKPQTNTQFIEIYDDGSTEKKIVVE